MTDWGRLADPFDDSDVKQRPGRGGMSFSYIDARAVAQRLDDVLTPAGWEFTCSVIPGSDVVKGRLVIDGIAREDHGYPNSDNDDEPIKAATSDALKRCAVLFGVGRHLYDDNKSHRSPQSSVRVETSPPGRPSPARTPARSSTDVPEEPDWLAPANGSGWTFKQLAEATEAAGRPKNDIYATADSLFGKGKKVTELTPAQREQIAYEMGLVA
jgi:hypothetical protein